jgi:hypothetical protein
MLQQYFLYEIWEELREYAKEYRERPFFYGLVPERAASVSLQL